MKIIATLVLLFAASAKKLTLRSSFKARVSKKSRSLESSPRNLPGQVDHLSKPSCNKMKQPAQLWHFWPCSSAVCIELRTL